MVSCFSCVLLFATPWNSPRQNTEVGSYSLPQEIFSTQGSNPVCHIAGRFFTSWATREAQEYWSGWLCCVLSRISCVWFFATPWIVARQAPLSMGFSRQKFWSRWLCPPPGDLPNPGTELTFLTSPALAGRLFTTGNTWGLPTKLCICSGHFHLESYLI